MQTESRLRSRILNVLKVLVSLGVLAIIVAKIDLQEVLPVLAAMDWLPFLGALALFLSGSLVRAYRWGSLVWALGVRVSWARLVFLMFVGAFFSQILPTGVGVDLALWYYFLLVPIISVFLMLPSLGGLGVREGVTLVVFTQVGVEEPRALALGLAYLLTLWITALLGAALYILQGLRNARRAD